MKENRTNNALLMMVKTIILTACFLAPISGFSLAKNVSDNGWLETVKPRKSLPVKLKSTPDQLSNIGACPSERFLKNLKGVRKINKGLGYSIIIQPSAKLFAKASGGAAGISGKFFKLFERLTIYKADKVQERVLVSNQDRSLCAWIGRDALLGLQSPGKMQTINKRLAKRCSGNKLFKKLTRGRRVMRRGPSQVIEACAPKNWYKKRSPLKLRAVIHNLSVKGGAKIPLYKSPGSRELVGSWQKFEIFDVFVARIIKRNKAINGRNGYYVLVGATTALGKTVHGWLHEDDIYIWPARMAAYWAGTGKAEGKINGYTVLREPKKILGAGNQILPRFPVLDSNPSAKDLNCRMSDSDDQFCYDIEDEEKLKSDQVLNHVNQFNIVVPGKYCKTDSLNDCISPTEYDEIMATVNAAIENHKKIDVVFLIDGTASMQSYFGAVAKAVRKFAEHYSTSNGYTDLRIAAVLYGDYEDNEPRIGSIGYRHVVPLHDPNKSLNINRLVKQRAVMKDPHNDLLEAPLGAIVRLAVEKQNGEIWRSNSGMKFIIHIADHGNNRISGNTNVVTSDGKRLSFDIDEKGRWQDIVKLLKNRGIFYAPIAVRGKYITEASNRFIEQASNISQALGQLSPPLALPLVKSLSKNISNVEVDIYDRLKDIISTQINFRESLALFRECAVQGMGEEECKRMIEAKGSSGGVGARFSPDDIKKAFPDHVQNIIGRHRTVLQVGIKPRKDNQDMLTYWMMVHEKDWDKFRRGYQTACNSFSEEKFRASSYMELKEALEGVAIAVTGGVKGDDDDDGETVGSLLKKIAYIFPGLMPPLDNLVSYSDIQDDDRAKWHKYLCKINAWFKRVDNNKTIGNGTQAKPYDMNKLSWDGEKWRAAPGSERDFNWRHTYGNGMVFYSIPVEFLSWN